MIADILSEAQGHFRADRLSAAEAFLRLMPRPATPPGDTWRELGRLHFALAQYHEAGRAFGYAAAHRPDDADLQVDLALTCLKMGDIDNFEGYLTRALKLEPGNGRALKLLADLHRDVGSYTEAAEVYRRLVREVPDQPDHRVALALCLALQGRRDEAIEALGFISQAPGPLFRG
jgi:cytochrome c-type biogenesis protein CcmH